MWAAVLGLAVLATATWFSWPHLRLWWHFEPLGWNVQGYPEFRHRRTGIVFVSLPGGTFLISKDFKWRARGDSNTQPPV